MEKFPDCPKCSKGVLLPLSDYGREGSEIRYKAWRASREADRMTVEIRCEGAPRDLGLDGGGPGHLCSDGCSRHSVQDLRLSDFNSVGIAPPVIR